MIAIVRVGAALAALVLTGFRALRSEVRSAIDSLRGEMRSEVGSLREEVAGIRARIAAFRERMAHLEGFLEGLREAITPRGVWPEEGKRQGSPDGGGGPEGTLGAAQDWAGMPVRLAAELQANAPAGPSAARLPGNLTGTSPVRFPGAEAVAGRGSEPRRRESHGTPSRTG